MMSQDLNVCWSCLVSATLSVVILSCVTQGIPVPRNFSSFRNILLPRKSNLGFYDRTTEDSDIFESNSSKQTLPQIDTQFLYLRDIGNHMNLSLQKYIDPLSTFKDDSVSYNMKFPQRNVTDDANSGEKIVHNMVNINTQFYDKSVIPNLNLGDLFSEYNDDILMSGGTLFPSKKEFTNLNNSLSYVTHVNKISNSTEKTAMHEILIPLGVESDASNLAFPFLSHMRNGKSVKRFVDKFNVLSHTLENVTNNHMSPVVSYIKTEKVPMVVQELSKTYEMSVFPETGQERTNNQNFGILSPVRSKDERKTHKTERKTKVHLIESVDKETNEEHTLPEFTQNTEIYVKKVTWKNNSEVLNMLSPQHYDNITEVKANGSTSAINHSPTHEPLFINSVKIGKNVTELTELKLDKTNNPLNDTLIKVQNKNKTFYKRQYVNSNTSLITDTVEHDQISLLVGTEINTTQEHSSTSLSEENVTAVSVGTQSQNQQVSAHIVAGNMNKSLDGGSITGIVLGILAISGVVGSVGFVLYRRHFLNKPQSLNDRCSNPDSSGYIDDSSLRENSEEMYSLDNDSFLNSLEAMTIQNYWTDNVKHTKL